MRVLERVAASRGVPCSTAVVVLAAVVAVACAGVRTRPVPPAPAPGVCAETLTAIFPEAVWLPLRTPPFDYSAITAVRVDGHLVPALLDTGAAVTIVEGALARDLGLDVKASTRGFQNAMGEVSAGREATLATLELGSISGKGVVELHALEVVVVDDPSIEPIIVGNDVLYRFDVLLAADAGLVGLFPPGKGPPLPGGTAVKAVPREHQLEVIGTAAGARGDVHFPMLVDTGATHTSIPTWTGVQGELPADVGYTAALSGVKGSSYERGRFLLRPLFLDDVRVGTLLALPSPIDESTLGLLGNDVLMHGRTLISMHDQRVVLADAGGCGSQLVRVSMSDARCAFVEIDGSLGTGSVEVVFRFPGFYVGEAVSVVVTPAAFPAGQGYGSCWNIPVELRERIDDDDEAEVIAVRIGEPVRSCGGKPDCAYSIGPQRGAR